MTHQRQRKSRNNSSANLLAVAVLILFTGVGCSDEPNAPTSSAAPARTTSKKVSTAPTGTSTDSNAIVYSYDPGTRRDPFSPIIVQAATQVNRLSSRPPLERYNIYEFKLTGILWGGFGYNAMVEGPDGKGYFVHIGTSIGLNSGVIIRITPNNLVVEEKFKTSKGDIDRKEIIIELRKKQEETR